jgi:hypothetical protein
MSVAEAVNPGDPAAALRAGSAHPTTSCIENSGHDSRQGETIAFDPTPTLTVMRNHSGLMFANVTTLAHFSDSSAINLPKSGGETTKVDEPKLASHTFSARLRAARTADPSGYSR